MKSILRIITILLIFASCTNNKKKNTSNVNTINNHIDTSSIDYLIYENIINSSTQRKLRELHFENKKLINNEILRINNERDSMYVDIQNSMDSLFLNISNYQLRYNKTVVDTLNNMTIKLDTTLSKQKEFIVESRKQNERLINKKSDSLLTTIEDELKTMHNTFDSLLNENNSWKKNMQDSINKEFKEFTETVSNKILTFDRRLIAIEGSVQSWNKKIMSNEGRINKIDERVGNIETQYIKLDKECLKENSIWYDITIAIVTFILTSIIAFVFIKFKEGKS